MSLLIRSPFAFRTRHSSCLRYIVEISRLSSCMLGFALIMLRRNHSGVDMAQFPLHSDELHELSLADEYCFTSTFVYGPPKRRSSLTVSRPLAMTQGQFILLGNRRSLLHINVVTALITFHRRELRHIHISLTLTTFWGGKSYSKAQIQQEPIGKPEGDIRSRSFPDVFFDSRSSSPILARPMASLRAVVRTMMDRKHTPSPLRNLPVRLHHHHP